MKRILLLLIGFMTVLGLKAQYINRDGYTIWQGRMSVGKATQANVNTILELGDPGTTKSMLLPRVSATGSVLSPVEGMFHYDLGDHKLHFHNGTTFRSLLDNTTTTDIISEGSTNLYFTQPRVLATPLTGWISKPGTLSATDNILQAFEKLDGNFGLHNSGAALAAKNYKPDSLLLYQFDPTKTLGNQGWDTTHADWKNNVTYSIVSDGLQITQPSDFTSTNYVASPIKISALDATTYMQVRIVSEGSHFYIGNWHVAASRYFATWEWLAVNATGGTVIQTDSRGGVPIGYASTSAPQVGDVLRIWTRRFHAQNFLTVQNLTQNTSITVSQNDGALGNEDINDYNPGIFLLTGSIVLQDFKVYSNRYAPDILFVGASIVQNTNSAPVYDSSYTGRVGWKSNLKVSEDGGSGDGLQDVRDRIVSILAQKPSMVAIGDMGFNDITLGARTYAQWQADYTWFVDTLHHEGIYVIIQNQQPSLTYPAIPDSINAFQNRTFTNNSMTYVMHWVNNTWNGAYFADGTGHFSLAGAEVYANEFVSQIQNFVGHYVPATAYTLPIATSSILGGIKIGSGLTIDPVSGIVTAPYSYTLPISSATVLGGIKIGSGLSVDPATGIVTASGGLSGLTTGQVQYAATTTTLGGDAAMTWDNTNKQLILGGTYASTVSSISSLRINNPSTTSNLEINGNGAARMFFIDGSNTTNQKIWEFMNYLSAFNIARLADNSSFRNVYLSIANSGNTIMGTNNSDDGVNKLQVYGSLKATQFRLSALNTAPTSSTDTGTTGEIRIVNGFIYVCVATNTWQRVALATF